jgi:hypothetical protein
MQHCQTGRARKSSASIARHPVPELVEASAVCIRRTVLGTTSYAHQRRSRSRYSIGMRTDKNATIRTEEETGQEQSRHRAPGRLNRRIG